MKEKSEKMNEETKNHSTTIFIGIFIMFVIMTFPPLAVAWGMKWEWTSFALGKADAWIGFWGGYLGAIIGALAAGAIAYFVAHNQIDLQVEKDSKREREFLSKQIRIEKYQEVYSLLSDSNREFALIIEHVTDYTNMITTKNTLWENIQQIETKVLTLRRRLKGLEPFIDDLDVNLEKLMTYYKKTFNHVNLYFKEQHSANLYKDSDGTEVIMPSSKKPPSPNEVKNAVDDLMQFTSGLCRTINEKLKRELESLERG
ncbi:hypothetical protein [Bacillus weihaiensis]|uniref:hypothetical protein n=1 Tax=Bacillus weihaiensis TaxID=1547283 RepID=UPI0023550E59|nr:hypothetical protein [Bacillus weihaiensis]